MPNKKGLGGRGNKVIKMKEAEFMAQLTKKNLYETTLNNLAPPYLDYEYFKDHTQLAFRYESNIFDIVNAWWLIEAATLVYADKEFDS